MAENKKSVLLYCDLIHTIEKLTDEQAGKFFKHYLRYVNDQNPSTSDPLVEIVFEHVKQNLKRDLRKWEKIQEERSKSGSLGNLKRWNRDLYFKVKKSEITLEDALIEVENRKLSLSDKNIANVAVNDNVNVNVNVNDIYNNNSIVSLSRDDEKIKKKKINKEYPEDFDYFWNLYPKRIAKKVAFKEWQKIDMNPDIFSKIMQSLIAQMEKSEWKKENGKYIPHPRTWLYQQRWEDDLTKIETNLDDILKH